MENTAAGEAWRARRGCAGGPGDGVGHLSHGSGRGRKVADAEVKPAVGRGEGSPCLILLPQDPRGGHLGSERSLEVSKGRRRRKKEREERSSGPGRGRPARDLELSSESEPCPIAAWRQG